MTQARDVKPAVSRAGPDLRTAARIPRPAPRSHVAPTFASSGALEDLGASFMGSLGLATTPRGSAALRESRATRWLRERLGRDPSPSDVLAALRALSDLPPASMGVVLAALPPEALAGLCARLGDAPLSAHRAAVMAVLSAAPDAAIEGLDGRVLGAFDLRSLAPDERPPVARAIDLASTDVRTALFVHPTQGLAARDLLASRRPDGEARAALRPEEALAIAETDPVAPLPHAEEAESHFDAPLDGLRVHRGRGAERAAALLGVKAFTVDDVVVFGEPAPTGQSVLHELTHVLQQGSTPRPASPANKPYSISFAPRESAAEAEAKRVARGSPAEGLRHEAVRLYAEDKEDEPDGEGAPPKISESVKTRVKTFRDTGPADFQPVDRTEEKGKRPFYVTVGGAKKEFLKSSKRHFAKEDYVAFLAGGPGKKDFEKLGVNPAERETFFQSIRLSFIGPPGASDLRTYAFAENLEGETAPGPYYKNVEEFGQTKPKPPKDSILAYEKAIDQLPPLLKADAKAAFDEAKGKIKDFDKATSTDAGKVREAVRAAIVKNYAARKEPFKEFYAELIVNLKEPSPEEETENADTGGPLFDNRSRGDMFEGLLRALVPTIDKLRKKPTFLPRDKVEVAAFSQAKSPEHAEADGLIYDDDGNNHILIEAKAVSTEAPDVKKGELYRRIIEDKIPAYFHPVTGASFEKKEKVDQAIKAGVKVQEITFARVYYYFPEAGMAERWGKALREGPFKSDSAKNLLAVFAVPSADLVFAITLNPTLTFKLPANGNLEPTLQNPPIKHDGVKVKKIALKLLTPNLPDIDSGSIEMDVDMKGLKKEGVVKPIKPADKAAPGAAAPEPKKGEKVPNGRVENKVEDLGSKLDQFLKRVKADARLTDDGVEADVTISKGPSGIPGILLDEAKFTVKYGKSGLKFEAKIAVHHTSGKIDGEVKIKWDGKAWTFEGKATVKDLIDGLEPFDLKIFYKTGEKDGEKKVSANDVKFSKKYGAVTITGGAKTLEYDAVKGSFSGKPTLKADLGPFGTAKVDASIADNALENATLTYDSPQLVYPPKSKAPLINGKVGGSITYAKGKFSGKITGSADLHIPALDKIAKGLKDLGLQVDVDVKEDGSYDGSIKSTKPVVLGDHLRIPALEAKFTAGGEIEADFSIELFGIGKKTKLESARIDCQIKDRKFAVKSGKIEASIGDPEKDRLWGSIAAAYSEKEGFTLGGKVGVKLKEGLVAEGTLKYDFPTKKLSAALEIKEITLLKYGPKRHKLFSFEKQIELVSFYKIIGIYLDAGFDLTFEYEMDLRIKPQVGLKGLSLETFEFDSAEAKVALLGLMVARLVATPKVGIGLFAISTKILRGGGGIKVPIAAEAKLKPSGTFAVVYTKEGNVKGNARVALSLTFGIKGSVRPYAELSVLDGAYNPKWDGDSLADFVILPERELFTYLLDFGQDLEKDTTPKLPSGPKEPAKPAADKRIETDRNKAADSAVDATKKDPETSAPANAEAPGKGSEGIDFKNIVDSLKKLPAYKKIDDILDSIGGAWGRLSKLIADIIQFFKNWFSSLTKSVSAVIKGIGEHGIFGYLKILLKEKYPAIYDVVEPVLTALGNLEEKVVALLTKAPPKSASDFFDWAIDIVKSVLDLGFGGVVELAGAIKSMISNLGKATGKFVNQLVQTGRIGVRRHTYYIPTPPPFKNYYFYAASEYKIDLLGFSRHFKQSGSLTSPESGVALVLYEVLDALPGVEYTNTDVDADVGKPRNDYWVD